MAAGITLAILVLPIVIITVGRGDPAVPDSIREAGFGVGATRWEVIRSQVLPYAAAGHPHRHRAVAGPRARRGGAAHRDRRDDRVLHRRRTSATSHRAGFTALPS